MSGKMAPPRSRGQAQRQRQRLRPGQQQQGGPAGALAPGQQGVDLVVAGVAQDGPGRGQRGKRQAAHQGLHHHPAAARRLAPQPRQQGDEGQPGQAAQQRRQHGGQQVLGVVGTT
jgi:hypothetical protein